MTPEDFLTDIVVNMEQRRSLLSSPAFREALYRHIHPKANSAHLPLLRLLFTLEQEYRSSEELQEADDYAHFENLYWCAFFLFQVGDITDVIQMWRAKNIDMDTACGFDAQFMVGSGPEQTIADLQHSPESDAQELCDYLQANIDSGTFSNLRRWYDQKVSYYAET